VAPRITPLSPKLMAVRPLSALASILISVHSLPLRASIRRIA